MPSLGMMTINSLVAADSIIIPAQPSFLSTKGLGLLRKSVTKVRRSINPKLTIDGMKEALCLSVSKSVRMRLPRKTTVAAAQIMIDGESFFLSMPDESDAQGACRGSSIMKGIARSPAGLISAILPQAFCYEVEQIIKLFHPEQTDNRIVDTHPKEKRGNKCQPMIGRA